MNENDKIRQNRRAKFLEKLGKWIIIVSDKKNNIENSFKIVSNENLQKEVNQINNEVINNTTITNTDDKTKECNNNFQDFKNDDINRTDTKFDYKSIYLNQKKIMRIQVLIIFK